VNRVVRVSALLLASTLAACNPFAPDPKDWYVKSVKGDTITLYHQRKIFVARCKGIMYRGTTKLITPCGYLVQHVGGTRSDGTGLSQIQHLGMGDITYYTDKDGEDGTHEVYEVVEETAQ
jgi:hypothetical protein